MKAVYHQGHCQLFNPILQKSIKHSDELMTTESHVFSVVSAMNKAHILKTHALLSSIEQHKSRLNVYNIDQTDTYKVDIYMKIKLNIDKVRIKFLPDFPLKLV